MKLNYLRRYHRFLRSTRGLFSANPILGLGLALPFAVVPTVSLTGGAALCLTMAATTLPTLLLAGFLGEKVAPWLRVALYPFVASLFLIPCRMLLRGLFPSILDSLGIYFSLACVSTLLLAGVEQAVQLKKPGAVALHWLWCALGFSGAVIPLSLFRELIGRGTLWGRPVAWVSSTAPGVSTAFGGLILLGFLIALFRLIHRGLSLLLIRAASSAPPGGSLREEQDI